MFHWSVAATRQSPAPAAALHLEGLPWRSPMTDLSERRWNSHWGCEEPKCDQRWSMRPVGRHDTELRQVGGGLSRVTISAAGVFFVRLFTYQSPTITFAWSCLLRYLPDDTMDVGCMDNDCCRPIDNKCSKYRMSPQNIQVWNPMQQNSGFRRPKGPVPVFTDKNYCTSLQNHQEELDVKSHQSVWCLYGRITASLNKK